MSTNTNAKFLRFTPLKDAVASTKLEIQNNNNGEQTYLKTRYEEMNRQLYGGFKFHNLVLLAGLSGHGKSYFNTILRNDFLNRKINDVNFDLKVLHLNFEMDETDELMRDTAASTRISYEEMVSPYYKLTEEQLNKINNHLDYIKDQPVHFVSVPGNRVEVINTIELFCERFKDSKIVVSLDHILLVETLQGENELQTVGILATELIRIKKKYEVLIIILDQLNSEIEKPERQTPKKIIPKQSDIFGSKKIMHAVDTAVVILQPAKLGVNRYGRSDLKADNLVILQGVKRRKGGELPAFIFENKLNTGELKYITYA